MQFRERRNTNAERFETFETEVKATFAADGARFSGYVLDSSEFGIAVFLSKQSQTPMVNQVGELTLSSDHTGAYTIPEARVVRKPWCVGNKRGFALVLKEKIHDEHIKELLFGGTVKAQRIVKQRELALIESKSIEDDIRSYRGCIVQFFIVAQTVSAALTSIYFGLMYQGISSTANMAGLSFWRTMIAAIPGILAVGTSLLIAHKIASIVRAESFLEIIKQRIILGDFPREYKGWEASLRKFKMAINSSRCKQCEYQMSCGELKENEKRIIKERGLLRKPSPNLYFAVIFGILTLQTLFSMAIVVFEVFRFNWAKMSYFVAGGLIELLLAVFFTLMVKFLWDLRKGRYTLEKMRNLWLDLLEICPERV